MKMRLFGAVAPTAAAMLAIICPAEAQPGAGDSVTGSGNASDGALIVTFEIDARSGPSGENPTGHVTARDQRLNTLDGPVTCLAVDGNRATVNVRRQDGGISTQMWFDGATTTGADGIIFGTTSRAPDDCSPLAPAEFGFTVVVAFGDVAIHDAQPLPTSKDQCKKGGWKTFGVFKNQGDCVSFVATGGKNPPSGP